MSHQREGIAREGHPMEDSPWIGVGGNDWGCEYSHAGDITLKAYGCW